MLVRKSASQMCEACGLKRKNYGLASEGGKKRWSEEWETVYFSLVVFEKLRKIRLEGGGGTKKGGKVAKQSKEAKAQAQRRERQGAQAAAQAAHRESALLAEVDELSSRLAEVEVEAKQNGNVLFALSHWQRAVRHPLSAAP